MFAGSMKGYMRGVLKGVTNRGEAEKRECLE